MDIDSVSSNKNLLELFSEQVARQPDAVALMTPDGTISYSELQQRSDRIANALHNLGVGVGEDMCGSCLVGLCMPRGMEAICAILGILKAGGAYLPIDPSYPLNVQQRMACSADLRFLLIEHDDDHDYRATQSSVFAISVEHVLTIPELYEQSQHQSGVVPLVTTSSDHLFHVLYTSGSTDEPKGVCGTYKQMQHRLEWLWQAFPFSDGDICCQKTALHFVDASLEIFGTLLQGYPLIVAPDTHSTNPEKLWRLLAEYGVTRISLVVSQLRSLLIANATFEKKLPQLKLCIVSGECLTRDLVDAFQQALPDTCLVNLYGCSEVPEISYIEIFKHTKLEHSSVSIGYPISETEIHIVDENMRRVNVGRVGELLVGSHLQAIGYLNRVVETKARFIDNPFFEGGQQLYRTGDRVRMSPEGFLLFEGRVDDQVKVRGHRIELSAVETALKNCGESLDSVKVVVQEDPILAENRTLVAFVTPASVDTTNVLATLRKQTPRHLQVQRIIALDKLPLTPSGKVDRRKLSELAHTSLISQQTKAKSNNKSTHTRIIQLWKNILLTDTVGTNENFFEIGGDSLRLAQLHQHLCDAFPAFNLSLAELLEYPTVAAQINYLHQTAVKSLAEPSDVNVNAQQDKDKVSDKDIAVISMACRFPDAETPEEFWANLRAGMDSIADFSDNELEQPNTQLCNDPSYVKSGAVLKDIAGFDADFFGFTDKEASILDPQQRLLLECAWEAMERAGIVPDNNHSIRTGIYAGSSASSYFLNNVTTSRPITEATLAEYQENLANDRNFLATRIAYQLQLTGPAINVQTACSTGLVVVHMACQSLRNGECDLALAGSVALKVPEKTGYLFEEGMIRSPDGRCRTFDAEAEGTLFGNGAGMVLLKPLAAAQADGDPILAVIKGSAINNDGALKVGFTAPSVAGQTEVVATALKAANVDPRTIGYVEAHGTGTRLGDPVEIAALTRAYTQQGWVADNPANSSKKQYCAIGSVKSNIGHLDEAAGIASFIKTVLTLQHKEIPPSLHFHTPNPEIDFTNSPFHVNTQLTPWDQNKTLELVTLRRAGVSSFGMGGTNCHLVLEEAPSSKVKTVSSESGTVPSHHLLVLSAASHQALHDLVDRYRDLLTEAEQPSTSGLVDVCATAAIGRTHFPYRYASVATSVPELSKELSKQLSKLPLSINASMANGIEHKHGKIAFLFTGQGAQYFDMAHQLYTTSAPFRASVDRCAAILDPVLPIPLLSVIFAAKTGDTTGTTRLSQTQYTQPALFTIEFALAELWQSWGITPDLVMGHSVGEYVAACVAGVFELEDALHIVAERGRLIQALPDGGGMLAVALGEAQVEQLLQSYAKHVCIAAINTPTRTVISGDLVMLRMLAEQLQKQGVLHKFLDVSHAFHSASLEPMLEPFTAALAKLCLSTPKIPVIANVTGDVISSELATTEYWVNHTRQAVRFADGIKTLQEQHVGVVLEIGPSPTLLGMVAETTEHLGWKTDTPLLLPSLRKGKDDWSQLLGSLGRLYEQGFNINWRSLYNDQTWRKVVLPTTPFQRKHYWVEQKRLNKTLNSGSSVEQALEHAAQRLLAQGMLTKEQLNIVPLLAAELQQQSASINNKPQEQWRDLLYTLTWQRLPIIVNGMNTKINSKAENGYWVILADQSGIGTALAAKAEAAGITVLLLYAGKTFASQSQNSWTVNPADPQQFSAFWQHLSSMTFQMPIQRLVYLWGLDETLPSDETGATAIMHSQQLICGGVLGLLPWLSDSEANKLRFWLVTCGAQTVGLTAKPTAKDTQSSPIHLNPLQATLWGLGRNLALEYPQAWGGLIDLNPEETIADRATALWTELNLPIHIHSNAHEEQVVLRGSDKYVARLKPKPFNTPSTAAITTLQAEAAYLVTGGLGALGLEIAETLTTLGARYLILLSRRGVTTMAQRQRLEALCQSGVTIQTPKLDVTDKQAIDALFAGLSKPDEKKKPIPLKGIIHAAGIIASTPSAHPSWYRFSSVLQAKVMGSWNLHQASHAFDLDFFVLFSSASSLLGLSGHADYAAANAFLDALANYRLQRHLPALSISWGDWAGSGMAANTGDQYAMGRTGLSALPVAQARIALQQLIVKQGHLAVIRADWSRFITTFQAHQGFLSACVNHRASKEEGVMATEGISNATDIRTLISTITESKSEAEREQLLQEQLTIMVGKVMGHTNISSLDSKSNLLSLGFDSLMLIELRNQLRRELGLQIALPQMLQGPTITELTTEAMKLLADKNSPLSSTPNNPATESTGTVSEANHSANSAGEDQWTTIII